MTAPRQLIFFAATEADLHDPALTAAALDDIRAHGFDGIYLEYRNLRTPLEAPRARAGVARIAAQAQERGLAVALDVSANHLHPHLVREHPEAFVEALRPHWLQLRAGRAELVTGGEALHHAIVGAWRIERRGDGMAAVQAVAWREAVTAGSAASNRFIYYGFILSGATAAVRTTAVHTNCFIRNSQSRTARRRGQGCQEAACRRSSGPLDCPA